MNQEQETVGRLTEEDKPVLKLTGAEKLVLAEMNAGYYLVKIDSAEGLTLWPHIYKRSISKTVKSGTIKRLLEMELIYETVNKNRFLLTTTGRAFK